MQHQCRTDLKTSNSDSFKLKDAGSFSVSNLEFMENLQYNMGVSNETVNARKTKSLKNVSHNVGLSSVLR